MLVASGSDQQAVQDSTRRPSVGSGRRNMVTPSVTPSPDLPSGMRAGDHPTRTLRGQGVLFRLLVVRRQWLPNVFR